MAPCLPRIGGTAGCMTWWVSATLLTLNVSKWGLFAKDQPLESGRGCFCTLSQKLTLPPLIGLILGYIRGRLWMSPSQRPDNVTMRQTSPGGTVSLKLWRKRNWAVQISWCCLEAEFKRYTIIWVALQIHLDTAMPKMSWIWVHYSCTFETGITPPSEPCKAQSYQQAQLWYEKGVLYPKWHAQVYQYQSDIRKTLISFVIGMIQSNAIQWWRGPEPKHHWMTGK